MDDATRKRLFRTALAIDGVTARDWGRARGIQPGYLAKIVNGTIRLELVSGSSKRTDELMAEVEAYTKETLDRFVRERAELPVAS